MVPHVSYYIRRCPFTAAGPASGTLGLSFSGKREQTTGQARGIPFEFAAALDAAIAARTAERNASRRGTDWRFTTADARIKLHSLYPVHVN